MARSMVSLRRLSVDVYDWSEPGSFLVYFSKHAADQGETTQAWQLLNEAICLSEAWDLAKKRPEAGRRIFEQSEALERLREHG